MTKNDVYQNVLNNKARFKKEEIERIVSQFVIKFNNQVDRWADTKFEVYIPKYYGHNSKTEIYDAIINHNSFYKQVITKIETTSVGCVYIYCDLQPSLFLRIKTYLINNLH